MTYRRPIRAGVAAMWLLVASFVIATTAAQAAAAAAGQLLIMSDIHFDPMAEPSLVDRLAGAEPAEWQAIFDGTGNASPSQYGKDTNWPLFRSALQQMKAALAQPAFVLLPGDFLAHQFRNKFYAAAHDHSDGAYRQFVLKTMRFLALQFENRFPGTPILPVLGNNDEYCGDYQLTPNGPFLADTLPILRALLGGAGREPGFEREWTAYGNASATVHGVRVLLANTIFFSRNYQSRCSTQGGPDPGRATLAWIESELAAARRAHQLVWLVYHIPPGIDGYATWRRGSCPDKVIPMWDDRYVQPFTDLLRRYRDTVVANFAGHTHMDDFRLVGDGSDYFGFVLITPALSPIFGQNPAFRTVAFDNGGGLLDQTTYELANLSDMGTNTPPKWRPEYTFTREWRLPRLDLPNLERLYTMITQAPEDRARWRDLFVVSSAFYWPHSSSAPEVIRTYDCATGHVALDDFRRCDCGATK
ncbi:MAG TPA: metallophosphoesterase [Stellaceae bacterium]|nr:metallophosphoesterase [Stellaceae bacterium]